MNRKQFLALLVACTLAAFSGAVTGPSLLSRASAQVAPLGNGGPAVGCADATITCTGGYNVQLNLGNADTWTAAQTFSGGLTSSGATTVSGVGTSTNATPFAFNNTAGTCAGAPTTIYGACFGMGNGTTNLVAEGIGYQTGTSPWTCVASCTASNSAQTCWYAMTTTGVQARCIYNDTGNVMNLPSVKINNQLDMAGNAAIRVGKLTQFAANDVWGSCAMAASTSCTITWTYAPTYCSKPNPVGTTQISGVTNISTTTITITASASNSATWDVTCS